MRFHLYTHTFENWYCAYFIDFLVLSWTVHSYYTFYFRRNKKYVYWNMVVRCTIFRDHEQGFFTFIQFTYSFPFFFWRLPSKYTYIYTEWRSRIAMLTMKYINTAHELLKVMLENHNLVEYFVGLNRNDAADPTTGPGRIARLSLPNVENI